MSVAFTDWDEDLYLAHHGILGQKWGIRRFRNRDGSLTPAGKKRYSGGSIGNNEYNELKSLVENVRKANEIFSDSNSLNSKYHVPREVADKQRDKAYKKLDEYGEKLVKIFAKSDPEFKAAIEKRNQAKKKADEEWDRIEDDSFIRKIATNKRDPRHKWFIKVGDHYEFDGDGTEYWEQFASEKAQDDLSKARSDYRKSCHQALRKMLANVSDRKARKAVRDKNPNYNGWGGTDLMNLSTTRRMSQFMENHFDWIFDDPNKRNKK